MTLDEIIKGLEKIAEFFKARADMSVGDAKMLLLNWVRCAEEAAEVMRAEGKRAATSSDRLRRPPSPKGKAFWGDGHP